VPIPDEWGNLALVGLLQFWLAGEGGEQVMSMFFRCSLLAAAPAILASGPARAQGTTAALKGTLTDRDDEPLPGIPITVTSATHGSASRTSLTGIKGTFRFQLLPPAGDYMLSIKFPGFAHTVVGPIDLDPGKTTIQNIMLSAADELTERIEVTAHGSIVDIENTKTSTTFNKEYIEGLPIIGRSYLDILTLTRV
jgi:hypothetical protein